MTKESQRESTNSGSYDRAAVERFFDRFGFGEFERHDTSPEQRIKFELHVRCLREYVRPGSRVMEVGPGPGRFTEILAGMGCRITVAELSSEQLRLNEERARERGYADRVERWVHADVCDLADLGEERFEAIVAFGGPFSYVLDRREAALDECMTHLAPGGRLLLSVMSKWGTDHAFLDAIHDLPSEEIEAVMASGDVTPSTSPSSAEGGHFFHMFTADELRDFLASRLDVEFMAASNALSTGWSEILETESSFRAVLELEAAATRSPGALDMGTHILAVASKRSAGGR